MIIMIIITIITIITIIIIIIIVIIIITIIIIIIITYNSTIDGDTPLHRAAGAGHTEVVRLLVAAGANVAAKNAMGRTVRQLADQSRSTAVIAALTPSAV